ncbi:cell division protein FtsQ/DivIB [Methyloceanibacter sp.]|uniref:cell division protein FtsQ/DivIB n=1 Tax=Methyloceanibacter sp. TaxID=1965321 RepID=UPI00351B54F3
MQQVRRGTVRKRGSQQALLARGIAAPRKTSTGLPVLAQARRLITRTPRTIRLGRIGSHARSKWLVLCALVFGSAVVYGAVIGGQTTRAYDALASALERSAIAAGFGVKKIAVTGQLHATDAAITAALGAGPDTMMLGFDTDAAKTRLETVPWIRHAQVMRLLPSTLQVMVEERSPFAVWQSKGQTYVVDAEGVVLAPALRDAYTDLPLVVGEGAAKNAAALVAQLAAHDDLNKQILAAIRVGDRRWTLKLLSGAEVMLPDDNVPEALASLVKLDGERRVLERDIATVDLRLLDRITVRLRAAEATRLQDATQDDIPTASTKSTPAKGKT